MGLGGRIKRIIMFHFTHPTLVPETKELWVTRCPLGTKELWVTRCPPGIKEPWVTCCPPGIKELWVTHCPREDTCHLSPPPPQTPLPPLHLRHLD